MNTTKKKSREELKMIINEWVRRSALLEEELNKSTEKIKDLEETIKQKDEIIVMIKEVSNDLLTQVKARDKRIDELHVLLSKKLG
jgi:predicted  nucleic acid-binding Zn-ribbon protein